jgi:CO/xanthine dehydrogenase Mo-binding subunit
MFACARWARSAALAAPGVLAVLTAADLTNCDPYYGTAYKDQPSLAGERIRYAGEPVAVVIAATERQAAAALKLLEVSLSEYPAVLDAAAALAEDAPILHGHVRPAGHFRDISHVQHVPYEPQRFLRCADLTCTSPFMHPVASMGLA